MFILKTWEKNTVAALDRIFQKQAQVDLIFQRKVCAEGQGRGGQALEDSAADGPALRVALRFGVTLKAFLDTGPEMLFGL